MKLRLSDFRYDIPDELVAQQPLPERSASRLLVRNVDGDTHHAQFEELGRFLKPGTLLVYNDSRVIPGRILTQTKHGGKLEIMLLRPIDADQNIWTALAKPFRKFQKNLEIQLDNDLTLKVLMTSDDGPQPKLEITFNRSYLETLDWLEGNGYIPLPPYIHRSHPLPARDSSDKNRYQTVYARELGSVAAPTAGLHFSPQLWEQLQNQGIIRVPLTLHVGGGTFLPVKTENIGEHSMHKEVYRMPKASWDLLLEAEKTNAPIVCVGTTSLRCLESFARLTQESNKASVDMWQETDLFLYPEHEHETIKPWGVTGLITNFHQPESSLLMLVSALIGYRATMDLYKNAISEKYRFYSYGDASLLWL